MQSRVRCMSSRTCPPLQTVRDSFPSYGFPLRAILSFQSTPGLVACFSSGIGGLFWMWVGLSYAAARQVGAVIAAGSPRRLLKALLYFPTGVPQECFELSQFYPCVGDTEGLLRFCLRAPVTTK